MHIVGDELQRMTATAGIRVGSTSGGSITVDGITQTNSDTLLPLVTLMASHNDAKVVFDTTASTFYALAAQADNGVVIKMDVTTDTGSMYLDGDSENSSADDGVNTVGLTDGIMLTSKIRLTLEATTGSIVPAGELS
jgi:hypothetical protein